MKPADLSPKTAALFLVIPAIACAVAVRQAYLCRVHHLSTWKDGGMGMFASANSGDTRFVRTYIEAANGDREPIIQFTGNQQSMLQGILWYPTRRNFEKLARSLRHTTFVATKEPSPVYFHDETGKAVRQLDRAHRLLRAHGQRSEDDADWTLVIEYWETSYDPTTQKAKIELVDTMRFDKEAAS